jgi:transposase
MAYINKTSLRDEFEHLKSEFNTLSANNKINAESMALFKAMIILFDVLIAIFLEKNTKKTTENSSKPSSQTPKDESATTLIGSKGKGRQENDAVFANARTKETIKTAKVDCCSTCGEDLSNVLSDDRERRTKIDIFFEKVIVHVDAESKECPICRTRTKGDFPAAMKGPLQYGAGVKAYVLNLLISQMVSLNRVQKLLKTLIGKLISEATMLKYVIQLHAALESWEKSSIECLLQQPAMNVDETSLRVDKKNYWIHVYSAGDITCKFLHANRGKAAIDDIDIIPRYGGDIIHDCWASYLSYDHCGHGLCGSHLLRELTFIVDSNGYAWAANIKKLLQETCGKISKRKRKKLNAEEYKNLQKRYRNILTRGEKELPAIPTRKNGQRGKVAKSDAHNLWQRLKEYETAVLLFARKSSVSFTNNRAERDLRMSKVKQKVSGCFRQRLYAQAYCRISSYLQTMANKGYNPLVAIQMALSGQIYTEPGE